MELYLITNSSPFIFDNFGAPGLHGICVDVIKGRVFTALKIRLFSRSAVFLLLPRVSALGEKFFAFVIKPLETPSKFLINAKVLPSSFFFGQ